MLDYQFLGGAARYGLDAPHPAADAGLAQHHQRAHLPGGVDVGAAADLEAERVGVVVAVGIGVRAGAGHADDAHHVAVPVAEEGQRTLAHRVGVGGLVGGYGQVLADLAVGEALHGQLLVGSHRAHVVEVEPQPPGVAQRAGLPDVGAKHRAQGGVEQVCAAVVARCVEAALGFHLAVDGVAQRDVALCDHAAMHDESGHGALGVLDVDAAVGSGDDAAVADLSAALGVETGLGQHDLDLLPPGGLAHRLAVAQDAEDAGLYGRPVVAVEGGVAGAQVLVGSHDFHAAGDLVSGAVALALGFHLGVEAVHVHGQAVLAPADLVHQLGREAVGVVEDEGSSTRYTPPVEDGIGRNIGQAPITVLRVFEQPLGLKSACERTQAYS